MDRAENPSHKDELIEIAKARIEQHGIRVKTLQELANLHRDAAAGIVLQTKAHAQTARAGLEALQAAHLPSHAIARLGCLPQFDHAHPPQSAVTTAWVTASDMSW